MSPLLLLGAYVLLPAVIIRLIYRYPWLDKIGPVLLSYAVGMALGAFVPGGEGVADVQDLTTSATVALALPLLLFSIDVKAWFRLAGKATLSMVLAVVSVIIVAGIGFFVLRSTMPEAWQLGGMAVGLYTGGTPNLAAIRTALGVDPDIYIAMHTYDTVVGALYIVFAVSLARPLFSRFLPRFDGAVGGGDGFGANPGSAAKAGSAPRSEDDGALHNESIQSYRGMLRRDTLVPLLGAFGASALIVGASVGLAELFPSEHGDAVTILAITALAIGASFIPKLRSIPRTFSSGMYLIYVFSIAVGSMADFRELFSRLNGPLLAFVVFAVFGSLFLHAFFARIFRIDADTMIITSVSAICSPPFVPAVANALGNERIILSGLYTGIIGYAVGNFLGISVSYLLQALG